MKNKSFLFALLITSLTLVITSCEKDVSETEQKEETCCCCTNDGMQMRMAMQEDGYTEVEVNSIEKIDCYFEDWNKTILTAVSGLLEYYDQNDVWIASIDFGDGTCDQWATKTWNVDVFPENPEGSLDFSLFE